jgi:actin-related protein 5
VRFGQVGDLLDRSDVCSSTSAKRDGLVINLGNVTSSVIPVLNGKGLMNRAKRWVSVLSFRLQPLTRSTPSTIRIPWGGSQASELMLRLAQLKYPSFPFKVTSSQATVRDRSTGETSL